jgi:hypothetical protein
LTSRDVVVRVLGENNITYTPFTPEEAQNRVKKTKYLKYGDENYSNIEKANLTKKNKSDEEKSITFMKKSSAKKNQYENMSDEEKEDFKTRVKNGISKKKEIFPKYDGKNNESLRIVSSRKNFLKYILGLKKDDNNNLYHMSDDLGYTTQGIGKLIKKFNLEEHVQYFNGKSFKEKILLEEINKMIPGVKFLKNKKFTVGNKKYELDLFNEESGIGIEFNGSYWHSDEIIADSKYHQEKSMRFLEKGIFIYHI